MGVISPQLQPPTRPYRSRFPPVVLAKLWECLRFFFYSSTLAPQGLPWPLTDCIALDRRQGESTSATFWLGEASPHLYPLCEWSEKEMIICVPASQCGINGVRPPWRGLHGGIPLLSLGCGTIDIFMETVLKRKRGIVDVAIDGTNAGTQTILQELVQAVRDQDPDGDPDADT